MHDYHAIGTLIERLEAASLDDVGEVRIRAGAAFTPESLQQAYAMLTRGTSLQGSRLVIEDLKEERTCTGCGNAWIASREDVALQMLTCPSCGALVPLDHAGDIDVVGITRTRAGVSGEEPR